MGWKLFQTIVFLAATGDALHDAPDLWAMDIIGGILTAYWMTLALSSMWFIGKLALTGRLGDWICEPLFWPNH